MANILLIILFVYILKEVNPQPNNITNSNNYGSVLLGNSLIYGTKNQTIGTNKTYYSFRGIPYAKPPIGNLRFKPPVPLKVLSSPLHAFTDRSECVQNSNPVTGSEDCLFLNVYTPKINSSKNSLPVMVWIYGGTFIGNNASYENNAPDFLLDNDVIMVSLNYRLGVFGFLSTGDLVLPGNLGLKDQNLALQWVQKNIGYFGGNPKNVTIFGESAGSVSVSLHLQSKLSQGLFKGAIMESGTSLCLWGLSRVAKKVAFTIGQQLNVNTSTSQSLIDGLRNISYDKLQTFSTLVSTAILLSNPKEGLVLAPVIEPVHDGAFFTNKSHEVLSQGNFTRVPTIIGFNSLEGYAEISTLIRIYLRIRFDLNLTSFAPVDMNINSYFEKLAIGSDIKFHYMGLSPVSDASQAEIVKFISDDQFFRPITETVKQMSKFAPVYFYEFSYQGTLGGENHNQIPGVVHGEELNYIFRKDRNSTETDRLVRSRMVKLWTNFAKYGNPTPGKDPLLLNVTWPAARQSNNNDDLSFINITDILNIQVNPFKKDLDYWNNLFTKLGNPPFDTY